MSLRFFYIYLPLWLLEVPLLSFDFGSERFSSLLRSRSFVVLLLLLDDDLEVGFSPLRVSRSALDGDLESPGLLELV